MMMVSLVRTQLCTENNRWLYAVVYHLEGHEISQAFSSASEPMRAIDAHACLLCEYAQYCTLQGKRVAGSDLSPIPGNNQAAFVAPCTGHASQQWTMGPAVGLPGGYLQAASGRCLNVDNCKDEVIVIPACPVWPHDSCCLNCTNMIFNLDNATGVLRSGEPTQRSVFVDWQTLLISLQSATTLRGMTSSSTWAYDAASKALSIEVPSELQADLRAERMCVTDNPHGVHPSTYNIWARSLSTGKIALLFMNVGSQSVDLTCDAACLANAGVIPGHQYAMRDLWLHQEMGTLNQTHITAPNVTAEGGCTMLLLTPQ
eukprot:m.281527 g.281527  ORF g.281527 m.281527 type:complete len:315 (+) comp19841_c0_seq2:1220-2164(+)